MNEADGIVRSWLAEQSATVDQLSAASLGFSASKLRPDWLAAFREALFDNRNAARLVREGLPKCQVRALAGFVVLAVSTQLERRLIGDSKRRGDKLKSMIRTSARNEKTSGRDVSSHERILANTDKAFDTRRKGLADYCEVAFVVREYFRQRCGLTATPRELAAVLEAGLVASGKPKFYQKVDHDLLARNLRNFEARKKNQAHCYVIHKQAVSIIEGRVSVPLPSR